jgi:hypothetical protein
MSLVSFAPGAHAATILFQIDDLTDTVTTTHFINGIAQTQTTATESSSIFASFLGAPANITGGHYNIYDPDGVTLSDTYSASIGSFLNISTGVISTELRASFLSDGNGTLTPVLFAQSLIETGDWQTVTTFSLLDAAGAVADTVTVQFRSEVETPLPAALPLFATGLGALGLLGWRRKRKQAA